MVHGGWLLASLLSGGSLAAAKEPPPTPKAVSDFGDNPGELAMYYSVSPQREAAKARHLVVVLHGCGQQAVAFSRQSGWQQLAREQGFDLLLPQQQPANNQKLCFNWYREEDIQRQGGELHSIASMITHAVSKAAYQGIYITGLSAGGAMTAAMLATYPEQFAAGAVVAGVPYRCGVGLLNAFGCMQQGSQLSVQELAALASPTSPTAPWPRLSIWHGRQDNVVNVANASALKRQWLGLNRLPEIPAQQHIRGAWQQQQWTRAGEVSLEVNLIDDMTHGQAVDPQREGEAAPFILAKGISTAREISRFFGVLP